MERIKQAVLRGVMFGALVAAFAVFVPTARGQSAVQKNYSKNCVACHGADGSANTPAGKATKALDFHSAAVQSQTDDQLAAAIASGKTPMPGYAKQLKPDEIKDLVAYVRQLGKQK
jgi:mono/diheme cytochrome c family protein